MNTHMTQNLTGALRSAAADAAAVVRREAYVDVFRGLLIAHMALDHASLMFNAGRAAEELAAGAAPAFGDLLQFLTRFTGVPVAPAFFFMAGFMVAMTSTARAGRGVAEADITRRLVIRGLVLIAADALDRRRADCARVPAPPSDALSPGWRACRIGAASVAGRFRVADRAACDSV